MKKTFFLGIVSAGVILLSAADYKSAGPPGCYAGEPPNNNNCTYCHTDYAVNSGTATILFDVGGADTGYTPGAKYTIRVAVKKPGLPAAGFLFTAQQDNNNTVSPGTITLNDIDRTQKVDPANPHVHGCALLDKVYVEHTYNGHTSNAPDENSWDFEWQAPPNDVGDITFYLATVESNYSGDEFGDYVYTRKLTSKGKTTGVDKLSSGSSGIKVFPNPATTNLNISTDGKPVTKIEIVTMQGVRVKRIVDNPGFGNTLATVDISDLGTGIYFVIVNAGDQSMVSKVVKQ